MPEPLNVNDFQRIRWACRRGMLELDVLLGNFYEDCYKELSDQAKQAFVDLLLEEDPVIFQSLMGQKEVQAKYRNMVKLIMNHAWYLNGTK